MRSSKAKDFQLLLRQGVSNQVLELLPKGHCHPPEAGSATLRHSVPLRRLLQKCRN